MTLLHLLRKQLKWKDKETDGSEKVSPEGNARFGENGDLSLDSILPQILSDNLESGGTANPPLEKPNRVKRQDDSASGTVIKTLIHIAATSDEGYERDRAILSITGGNNIVDALKILIDPAFLSKQAAYTSEIYSITDSNGRNVAHYAVSMGHLACVEFLASAAPGLFLREDSAHRTPAYIAAALGQNECLRVIAQTMEDALSVTDGNGVSPAHAAALQGELECVKILAELAPHLFYLTEASQKTPAHIAVFAGRADVVEAIGKAVPDSLKITDADQLTPAHLAIMHEKKDCLNPIMLYAPDSTRIPNSRGITAEQMLASDQGTDSPPGGETDFPDETGFEENAGEGLKLDQKEQAEQLQAEGCTSSIQKIEEEQGVDMVPPGSEPFKKDYIEENEIAMLKCLLKNSLQLEVFLDQVRRDAEITDFEQDSLGVAFKLSGGSVLAMANNGVIFSAIYSDNQFSTTILVEALTGGIGKVVEE